MQLKIKSYKNNLLTEVCNLGFSSDRDYAKKMWREVRNFMGKKCKTQAELNHNKVKITNDRDK